ncbi:unnamed protein product [Phaeothamnion confervicola]
MLSKLLRSLRRPGGNRMMQPLSDEERRIFEAAGNETRHGPPTSDKRAAVGLILRVRSKGRRLPCFATVAELEEHVGDDCTTQLLLIQRAHNPRDLWSGHLALPGGRQEPGESDLQTVVRECREEVGLKLRPPLLAPVPAAESAVSVAAVTTPAETAMAGGATEAGGGSDGGSSDGCGSRSCNSTASSAARESHCCSGACGSGDGGGGGYALLGRLPDRSTLPTRGMLAISCFVFVQLCGGDLPLTPRPEEVQLAWWVDLDRPRDGSEDCGSGSDGAGGRTSSVGGGLAGSGGREDGEPEKKPAVPAPESEAMEAVERQQWRQRQLQRRKSPSLFPAPRTEVLALPLPVLVRQDRAARRWTLWALGLLGIRSVNFPCIYLPLPKGGKCAAPSDTAGGTGSGSGDDSGGNSGSDADGTTSSITGDDGGGVSGDSNGGDFEARVAPLWGLTFYMVSDLVVCAGGASFVDQNSPPHFAFGHASADAAVAVYYRVERWWRSAVAALKAFPTALQQLLRR